jgi:hypothetical protein
MVSDTQPRALLDVSTQRPAGWRRETIAGYPKVFRRCSVGVALFSAGPPAPLASNRPTGPVPTSTAPSLTGRTLLETLCPEERLHGPG